MTDLLSFVADYRTLLGKTALGIRISDRELRRLGALAHLLSEPSNLPESRRRTSRAAVQFRGLIRIGSASQWVDVLDVSAGGIGVAAGAPLPHDQLGVVEVTDRDTGHDYRMPARVTWASLDGRAGLAFLGIPVELRRPTGNTFDSRAVGLGSLG